MRIDENVVIIADYKMTIITRGFAKPSELHKRALGLNKLKGMPRMVKIWW